MKNRNIIIGLVCIIASAVCIGFAYSDMVYGLVFTVLELLFIPLALAGIVLIIVGIVQNRKAAKRNYEDLKANAVHRDGDDSLDKKLRQLKLRRRIFFLLVPVDIAIGLYLTTLTQGIVPFIIMIIVAAALLFIAGYFGVAIKNFISGNVVQQVLEEVFDDVYYAPGKKIPESYIKSSNVGLDGYDKIEGDDYVKAKYKGLGIEMSDITLLKEETRVDDEGHEEKYYSSYFKGLWLVCDFGKELAADMRIMERTGFERAIGVRRGIRTDNDEFNYQFHVESEIEAEAFYILTPHMMEYIMETDKKAQGSTCMCFHRNGKLQIIINSGRDSFEVGRGKADVAMLRREYMSQVKYVTDIIEELRLVDTIYRK